MTGKQIAWTFTIIFFSVCYLIIKLIFVLLASMPFKISLLLLLGIIGITFTLMKLLSPRNQWRSEYGQLNHPTICRLENMALAFILVTSILICWLSFGLTPERYEKFVLSTPFMFYYFVVVGIWGKWFFYGFSRE